MALDTSLTLHAWEGGSAACIFRSDITPKFQTHLPNCLQDTSTWDTSLTSLTRPNPSSVLLIPHETCSSDSSKRNSDTPAAQAKKMLEPHCAQQWPLPHRIGLVFFSFTHSLMISISPQIIDQVCTEFHVLPGLQI